MRPVIKCPECDSSLPERWPKGLCSQCALSGALELAASDKEPSSLSAEAGEGKTDGPAAPGEPHRFGDYELLEEIGRGGMGVIYRARQVSLNRTVALKMILAGQFASKQEVLRFRSEADAAADLQHPCMVSIHETGERDGQHYFSMDYVEGRTLADLGRDTPLPAARAARYAKMIAEGIHYAHSRGVLHRDLKPSNVIIDSHDQPRITDFGLAKRVRGDFGLTVTGQVLGSPNFMPPEQTSTKDGKAGPASDVYGMGATLYYLLTGRPPFQAGTIEAVLLLLRDAEPVAPRLLNPSVPRDLETICLKCLEKVPARRYPSAQSVADELGRFLSGEPIAARPLHALNKLWRWCRRRPAIAVLSAGVLLLLLVLTIGSSVAAWRISRARLSEQRANRDLRDTVSSLELQRAENFFRNGDAGTAVAHLAAMLRRDPSNPIAASRLISALVHRNWALRAPATMHHNGPIETLCFSPNGRHILSASRDQTAKIWDVSTGKAVAVLQHTGQVFCANYNSNGTRIVTACAEGPAQIRDATTGEPRTPPLQHTGRIHWAEFSADGRWVVTASADTTARIWDATSGALKHELRKHTSHVVLARFSPDGKRVATGGSHGSIRIWDADSGEMLFRVEDRNSLLTAMAFSPDGKRLVSICQDEVVRLWNLETRTEIHLLLENEPVNHAAFSPDSRFLLTGSRDATARIWDVNTGLPIGPSLVHEGAVAGGKFSPDGQKLVTLSREHSARLWDMRTRLPLCQPIRVPEEFGEVDFSPDGGRLVTAGRDGTIHVWDIQPRRFAGIETRFETAITCVAFSPDGERLLTASWDGAARVLDAGTGKTLTELPHEAGLYLAEFSSDGSRVFTASINGEVRLWDSRKGVLVAGPFQHPAKMKSVRFNPGGDRLAIAAFDETVRVWDPETWQPITPSMTHRGVLMAHFSPDGRLVLSAGEDHAARVWNASSGEPVLPPLLHKDHVKRAEFSPDGKRIVTASTDDTSCVWDLESGQPVIPPFQHTRIVESVRFSLDGSRVITASLDRTARIWDARTGGALTPPLKHDYSLLDACFARDGEMAMTGCWNGALRAWDAKTGQPLTESLEAGGWTPRFVAFDPTGRRMAMGGTDSIVRLWPIPAVPIPVPEWFLIFTESVAGIRLGDRGQVELVPEAEFETTVRDLRSKNENGFYGHLARWFLADPTDREPAPF